MSDPLGKPFELARDGENNVIEFDIAYPVKGRLGEAVTRLHELHGDNICLLPISGASCGGGIFQFGNSAPGLVVGLRFDPPVNPRVRLASDPVLRDIGLDEILIDTDRAQLCAGASVTLDQLNRALSGELGQGFRVPGADLTSYQYAAVGATFMTGGMGPQRRYFSDSVVEAAIHDGGGILSVAGDDLRGYAGSYGWSGIVGAIRCNYYRYPANEIAFALPVSDRPSGLARVLEQLSAYVYLKFSQARVESGAGRNDLLLGLEHVSVASMQPLLDDNADNPSVSRARDLRQKCAATGAEGLIFVNGLSERSIDDFLLDLCDERRGDKFSIAGIDLEFAEVFADPGEMRALREAIPYAARMQSPRGRFVYKNHTDANLRLDENEVGERFRQIWRINRDYVDAVNRHFETSADIDGDILVYGHLNPYGIDPHNRVTMSSDDEAVFRRCRDYLLEQRAGYYRALAALCGAGGAEFIGGEKTADSELGIFRALGGPAKAPTALYQRFNRQRDTIRRAHRMFNWRAPEPYL